MNTRSRRSPATNLILAIAAAISLLGGYYLGNMASGKNAEFRTATILPEAKVLKDFNLIDFDEQPFTLEKLKGHWSLIFFGYTNCPDICPTALTSMVEVNKALDKAPQVKKQIQTIFVSVDPKRDTPAHLKEYVSFFSPDFYAATGSDEELKHLTKQLALNFQLQKPDEKGNYLVDHSAWLVVIDPDARLHAVISGAHYPNPKAIADDIILMAEAW